MKDGVFIYSTKKVSDRALYDFLLSVTHEKISKFSITNAELKDAGICILSEFFAH